MDMKKRIVKLICAAAVVMLVLFAAGYANEVQAASYVKNGVDYSLVFNPKFYAAKYPNVAKKYNNDADKLFKNFLKYGIPAGRQGSANFDPVYYKKKYSAVRKACGDDMKAVYLHYIEKGAVAGKIGSADKFDPYASKKYKSVSYKLVFDPIYYFNNNADVRKEVGYDPAKLLEHFVTKGMAEGKSGIDTFDVSYYKKSNADLADEYADDLAMYYKHYIKKGYAENRAGIESVTTVYDGVDYSLVYNMVYYRDNNEEAFEEAGYDYEMLIEHFVTTGMAEGLQAISSFDPTFYRTNNSDLMQTFGEDLKQYYIHFMEFGHAEGRMGIKKGWFVEDGKKTYIKKGRRLTGWQSINGRRYFFDEDGYLASVVGIDVSTHQKVIDWEKVKADGVDFAIIRCGFGDGLDKKGNPIQDDAYFEANVKACEELGIPYGVYIFSYAYTANQIKSEFAHVERLCEGLEPELGIWFDLEGSTYRDAKLPIRSNGDTYTKWCVWFNNQVSDELLLPAGTYANLHDFAALNMKKVRNSGMIWLAQYPADANLTAEPGIMDCDLWQYASDGKVDGINGNTDMNAWYLESFLELVPDFDILSTNYK